MNNFFNYQRIPEYNAKWTQLDTLSLQERSSVSVASRYDMVYIFGGSREDSKHNDLYTYNLETREFKKVDCTGDLPPTVSGHTAVMRDRYMYIFGGFNGNDIYNSVHVLNTDTFEWKKINFDATTKQPPHRYHHTANIVHGSKMYVFGGKVASADNANDLWVFDLDTEKWEEIQPQGVIPPPRRYHASFVYNSLLFISSGYNNMDVYDDLWCFDIFKNEWRLISTFGDVPKPRYGHSLVFKNPTTILCFGGSDGNTYNNELYELDIRNPNKPIWTKLSSRDEQVCSERRFHRAAADKERMVVFFGYSEKGFLSSCHEFCFGLSDSIFVKYPNHKLWDVSFKF